MHNSEAKKVLSSYFKIISKSKKPKYLESKSIKVNFQLNDSDEKLKFINKNPTFKDSELNFSLLDLKIELCKRLLKSCILCERKCSVNRLENQVGYCKVKDSKIASEFIHMGEEPEIIPSYTIFFSSCTFNCVYCQNWDISQYTDSGIFIEPRVLAKMIMHKEKEVRNVNWVGGEPTPNLLYILEVLNYCNANLPQVWNSNMYMSEETMQLLNDMVDVYLSDFKYGNNACGERLSKVNNYFDIVARNHIIANKQTEMIIRHLVLPNHVQCCSKQILQWIAENLDLSSVMVNIMAQYRPMYKAKEYEEISRFPTLKEFTEVLEYGKKLGLSLV